jgi:DNA-binding CsgD family transcriptional regulator
VNGLVGREPELAELCALVDRAAAGRGGTLVVRGPAGIGKSALIEEAQRYAEKRGMALLSSRGVASETLLPFGGLHQLLWPLTRDATLPEEPRRSLRAALGPVGAVAPDFYAIALAALDLLVEAAERAPVLVIAEDAHWFDRSSADLLGFVARRVGSAPIALVTAVRDGRADPFAEARLPELALAPLSEESSEVLLNRAAGDLPADLRKRLLTTASGNPLALLELPASVRGADRDELSFSAVLPMNARLEHTFAARLPEMPPPTRSLLLAAAAEPSCTLAELLEVVATVGGQATRVEVLDPAVEAGLVQPVGLRLRFRHPLVASAVYASAPPSDRIAVHTALATALTGQPDRAIWHRMAAATGPDSSIAADLLAFADRAARRGAASVAVAALERAASFAAGHERTDLLLRAAELAGETGQARERLPGILEQVRHLTLSTRDTVRRVQVETVLAPTHETHDVAALAEHAERIWPEDPALAYTLLHASAIRCFWGDASPELRRLVRDTMDLLDPEIADPRSLLVHVYAAPLERGQILLRRAEPLINDPVLARRRFGAAVYCIVGEFPRGVSVLAPAVDASQDHGQILLLGRLLAALAGALWFTGDWDAATTAALDAERIGGESLEPSIWMLGQVHRALVMVSRGEVEATERLLAALLADPGMPGNRLLLSEIQKVRGIAALAAGRPDDAMDRLLEAFEEGGSRHHFIEKYWSLPDLAEAARASGRLDEARLVLAALDRLDDPVAGIRIVLAYTRAVLAPDDEAEPLYAAALAEDLGPWPLEQARLNLAYGRHLRRRQRITESRAPLRLAAELYERLGAAPWLAQARAELRATGAKVAESPGGLETLTGQELQIARLVAQGLSNREIGQRLFLSPRTVGSHLYKIFPKLGITNRTQLATALDNQ